MRRDLAEIRRAQSQSASEPTGDEPDSAPDALNVAAGDGPGTRLILVLAIPGALDIPRQNEAAARAAIRAVADSILEARRSHRP